MPCQGPYGGVVDDRGYEATRRALHRCEVQACQARWLALRMAAILTPSQRRPFRALVAKIERQQLAHRKGDQAQVLDKIAAKLRLLREDVKRIEQMGGQPGAGLVKRIARWTARKAKIAGLTDAQLLANYWGSERRYHDLHED